MPPWAVRFAGVLGGRPLPDEGVDLLCLALQVVEVAAEAYSALVVHDFPVRYRHPGVDLVDENVHAADFAVPVPRDAVAVAVLCPCIEVAVVVAAALVDVVFDPGQPALLLLIHAGCWVLRAPGWR